MFFDCIIARAHRRYNARGDTTWFAGLLPRRCEERERRSNPGLAHDGWIASLALAMMVWTAPDGISVPDWRCRFDQTKGTVHDED
jgi:hypothetical protein